MVSNSDHSDQHDNVNAFVKTSGGPLGLGDPQDRSLRHVEETIYVMQIIKDRAHREKCKEPIKNWGKCMDEKGVGWRGFLTFLTCKPELTEMNNCLKSCYASDDFRKECEQIYLDKRARYRETGVIEKDPNHKKPYYTSERKQAFLDAYRKQKTDQNAATSGSAAATDTEISKKAK